MSAAMQERFESEVQRADALRVAGCPRPALEAYLEAVRAVEVVPAEICVRIARCALQTERPADAAAWLLRVVDAPDDGVAWQAAAAMLPGALADRTPPARRSIRLAVLGSATTTQLAQMLVLAARRFGVAMEIYEGAFGQYQQEIIDPASGLYAFEPDVVLIAAHEGAVHLPSVSADIDGDLGRERQRWRTLWETLDSRCSARVVMHNFVAPLETPFGHLAARLPAARATLLGRLNRMLGDDAGNGVSIVDCERIASSLGKRRWFDDRFWHVARQAVSPAALPALARHTAAVIAADLGLGRKCLVLDLDNTLWGGVIGEAGVEGITLGAGPAGEAFVEFQRYIKALQQRGIVLAVCSKNNEADAREPFERHPDMVLKLEDIALFVANWQPKPENIRSIAETLDLGLDAIVFVDDNPAERDVVRQLVPDVEVVTLPDDPSGFRRALAETLHFEMSSFTAEDAHRTEQYRGRARIAELQATAMSLDDFHRGLGMQAIVAPFDEMHLPRIVQLIGKTNQFNLTTRRHSMSAVRQFMDNPDYVHFYLKLRDRFADHGLVSLLIAHRIGDVLDIDTWLMSCRVIGRTVEHEMLSRLCAAAGEMGCTRIHGTYVPTPKNGQVREVFARFGFSPEGKDGNGATRWSYDLARCGPIASEFIDPWQEPTVDAA